MNILRHLFIGLYVLILVATLPVVAAQVAPDSAPVFVARAVAWDGPEIKKKSETETKQKMAVVASQRPFSSMHNPILTMLPHELWAIVGQYIPYFYCSRELSIPHLKVPTSYHTKIFDAGACACFTDKNKQQVYLVEDKNKGHFRLYNQDGSQRAHCTAHTDTLTKLFVMPTTKERPYKFVTGSCDGTIRFWNEDGIEVSKLECTESINDFDIITDHVYKGKKRDILVATVNGKIILPICDISSVDHITTLEELQTWGNDGAVHVKLVPIEHKLTLITSETNLVHQDKKHAICWYDIERRRRKIDVTDYITRMDIICSDDEHVWVLLGHWDGIVKGYKVSLKDTQVTESFTKSIAAKKIIVGLKTYKDADNNGAPHAIIQAQEDGHVHDLDINTQYIDTFTPVSKSKMFYTGLATDSNGCSSIVTCSDGQMRVWKKDKDAFNYGCLEDGYKGQPAVRETPKSRACIIQ